MYNTVVVGKELEGLNNDVLEHLKTFVKSIEDRRHSIVTDGGLYTLGWLDSFRLFLDQYDINSSPPKKMVATSLYSLNKTCPWTIPLYFRVLLGGKSDPINRSERISSSQLFDSLKDVEDEFTSEYADVLYESMLAAGTTGSVSIENERHESKTIQVRTGFKTLLNLNDFFTGAIRDPEIRDCRIVVVNGAIIDVSEIHHLLDHAYETKENIAIVASSFSDDVANTLRVNWDSGKTRVIPFYLRDGLDTINESKDICDVLGIIPISVDTGLRISSIEIEDYPKNNLYYDKDKDELRIALNENTSIRAQKAKSKLQERYDEEKVDDVKKILSDRISRMGGRSVSIGVSASSTSKGIIDDRAGAVFSYFSRCARQNVVKMGTDYLIKYLPAQDYLRAVKMAVSDRKSLFSIKAVIRVDNE